MATNYKEIRNERQWKAMTGLSQQEFISLSTAFGIAYEKINGITLRQAAANLGKEMVLSSYEDCLYFTLFQLKTAQSFDCLGVLFNMDGAAAHRNFVRYVPVMEQALQQQGALPRRSFGNLNDFKKYLQSEEGLIVDATQVRTQRPADKEKQQKRYSGKKKAHTLKSLCLTNKKKRILYISKCYEGNCHDYHVLQDCFTPAINWFKQKTVRLDLGFQGFKDMYKCKKVYIPNKKKRVKKGESNELSEVQKAQNKEQAAERIKVEHSIGGMKRYRILSHRITLKSNAIINSIIGICAGLWNFVLK